MLAKQLAQQMNCFHFEKSNCYSQNSRKISNKENSLDVRFHSPPPKKKTQKTQSGEIMGNYITSICGNIRHWNLQIYWMPIWKVSGDRKTIGRSKTACKVSKRGKWPSRQNSRAKKQQGSNLGIRTTPVQYLAEAARFPCPSDLSLSTFLQQELSNLTFQSFVFWLSSLKQCLHSFWLHFHILLEKVASP